jgi:hypothetical protein
LPRASALQAIPFYFGSHDFYTGGDRALDGASQIRSAKQLAGLRHRDFSKEKAPQSGPYESQFFAVQVWAIKGVVENQESEGARCHSRCRWNVLVVRYFKLFAKVRRRRTAIQPFSVIRVPPRSIFASAVAQSINY